MTRSLIAVPLALLVLTGCTSDLTGHGVPASDAGGHQSAPPSATPAAMTLAQAGAKYQQLVAPTNAAAYAANLASQAYGAHPAQPEFQTLTRAQATLADAEERFVAELTAARWPATVQPAVDALVAALRPEIANLRRLAAAASPSEYAAAHTVEENTNAVGSARASALRKQLGIGDVPDISPPTP